MLSIQYRSTASSAQKPTSTLTEGDSHAVRLRQFAAEHGGALVNEWKMFGAASLFNETAE